MAETEPQTNVLTAWQEQALEALHMQSDPGVRFDVFARTAETCTDQLELLRLRGRDDVKALIAKAEEDARTGRQPDPHEKMQIGLDDNGGNILGAGRLMIALDDKLFSGENPLLKSADRSVKGIDIPDFVRIAELGEMEAFIPHVERLAQTINKYLGDEAIDFVLGLIHHLVLEQGQKSPLTVEFVKALPLEKKKSLVAYVLKSQPLNENQEKSVLTWALGTKFMHRLAKEHQTPEAQLNAVKQLLLTNESFRRKLLRAVYNFTLTSPRLVTSALLRWGWKTIADIDEVTTFEWWTFVKKQHEHLIARIAAGDEGLGAIMSSPRAQKRTQDREKNMQAFFETHPEPPPPQDIKKLREVIGCDRYPAELKQLKNEHDPRGYEEKQREIVARVSGAVSRYVLENNVAAEEEEDPSWRRGLPLNFRESKNATCFTGPWLIAMMLMECGIEYDDLIYVHVNQSHDSQIGGHGGLILKTKLQHMVFIDHGYNFSCRDLPTAASATKNEAELVNDFLNGKIKEAVTVLFAHAESDRIHQHMQFMPLIDGFSSGHLYHVGLSFFAEGDLDKAKFAFELAHTFNRQDPDILYHLGLVALRSNQVEVAEAYFQDALKIFPNHLFSEFGLGETSVKRGDFAAAKKHFGIVGESKFRIWKANDLKENAAKYAGLGEADLQEIFCGQLVAAFPEAV